MTTDFQHREALRDAINIVGSQEKLAKSIGKRQGHISFWLTKARRLPLGIAIKIEQATDNKVPRNRLCPELEQ